ncbi:CoA transferase [Rhodococcus fascians]|uniref:CaiB/BaiF CoA transferase family protein n=1 Tax=Rhodococcoides fascians TaxID=1828 RepID=UPI0019620537|nr:CoA transferase [Rhodococcus fascians]MBM7245148.1 CoA transferase [Rhodococcus fascians]MBY3811103.1 CoA transferase [Rhodococcus fascians]MBY3842606.1 CoA transferase [Rhodococcus fascians]MBY3845515.1 CoA transferase [Rhodococcus fascians]MBY3851753.1 CoA transferase [Rhodococcus fascians]
MTSLAPDLVGNTGSLSGVVVLDLSHVLAGAYAAQMFADFGATVIKIENPTGPDVARGFPPYLKTEDDEFSAYYAQYNRGKLGLTLDLRADEGKAVLKDLVAKADVLIENFRPGTTKKLGIDYAVLAEINPRLVYLAISGYGQTGSRSTRPAFDNTAQAAGGLWSMNGQVGEDPVRVGVTIGDLSATMFGVIGALTALRHAERTGVGQLVDVAQVDSIVAMTETAVVDYTVDGKTAVPSGNNHAWVRPYELFPCADGQVFFGGYTDKLWNASCELFGTPEAAVDPEIDTMRKRFDPDVYERRVKPLIISWFDGRKRSELEDLAGAVIPLTAIKNIGEVVDDEGTAERGMIVEADYGKFGTLRMFGQPIKMGVTPATPARRANGLGEHTDSVLAGLAGYSAERIADLRNGGVV